MLECKQTDGAGSKRESFEKGDKSPVSGSVRARPVVFARTRANTRPVMGSKYRNGEPVPVVGSILATSVRSVRRRKVKVDPTDE